MLTLALTVPTASAQPQTAPDLSWLRGEWVSCTPHERVEEHWIDAAPQGLVGAAVTRVRERASFEFVRIAPHEGGWAYLASPGGRSPATAFRWVPSDADTLTFENPAHDFPRRIRYRRSGEAVEVFAGGLDDQGPRWTYRRRGTDGAC